MRKLLVISLLIMAALSAVPVLSQQLDPLLQLLIEKNVLTQEEALTVQKEYDKRKQADAELALKTAEDTKKAVEETKKSVEEATKPLKAASEALKGLKIGGTYFLSYQNGNSFDASQDDGSKAYNKFVLKRAYLDIRKELTPYLSSRFTSDLYMDSAGDYKLRMKFLYADFHWKGNDYFSAPYLRAGMINFPWFEIEESIIGYRLQDTHFMDRAGIATTADLGVMFGVGFGEPLPKSYQDEVSSTCPGKWGSFELGVYNGGGYTANEKNTNKVIAGRVTLRPAPVRLPGLQFHLVGINGKGNVADGTRYAPAGIFENERIYPDWDIWAVSATYQHARFTLAGEFFKGDGNFSGNRYYTPDDYVPGLVSPDEIFKAFAQKGYSFFGDVKLGDARKWSLMARYDYYDPDTKDILEITGHEDVQKRYIYGVGYKLHKSNMLLFDYQKLTHSREYKPGTDIPDENRWQLTLQLKF